MTEQQDRYTTWTDIPQSLNPEPYAPPGDDLGEYVSQAKAGTDWYAQEQAGMRGYWENPFRVARYYNFIQNAPPDWQAPEWLDPKQIEAAYKYLELRNDGKPWQQWQPLPEEESAWYRYLPPPPNEFLMDDEQHYAQAQAEPHIITPDEIYQKMGYEQKAWEDMPFWAKATQIFNVGAGPEGRTQGSTELAQGFLSALNAVGGAAVGGAIGGPPGAVVGFLGTFLASEYQMKSGNTIPGVNEFLTLLDIGAIAGESLIGTALYKHYGDADKLLSTWPEIWNTLQAGQQTYETLGTGALPALAGVFTGQEDLSNVDSNALMNTWAGLFGVAPAPAGYTWNIQGGFLEPVPVLDKNNQVAGSNAAADAFFEVKQRLDAGEDYNIVAADMIDRFGDSGLMNDFLMQSVLDIALVSPGVTTAIGSPLAKIAGQPGLAAAIQTQQGSLISNVPLVGGAIANLVGAKQQGSLMNAARVYGEWVRSGYSTLADKASPETMANIDYKNLNWIQRTLGELTKEGELKRLQPINRTFWNAWRSETPESQASYYEGTLVDNINALIYNLDDPTMDGVTRADQLHATMDRYAGITPVQAGDAGQAILQSPTTASTQAAFRNFWQSPAVRESYTQWVGAQPKIAALNQMAQTLEINVAKLVEDIGNNPDSVLAALASKAQAGNAQATAILNQYTSPGNLKDSFASFIGTTEKPGSTPFTFEDYRARLFSNMSDSTTDFIAKHYGIKESPFLYRFSNLLKATQSMFLLDLNPAYLVNNVLNNWVTTAYEGVFGVMTKGQMDAWWKKFGAQPARISEGIGIMGFGDSMTKIRETMMGDGVTSKMVRELNKARNKVGVMSKMSRAAEKTESVMATTLGTMQMWTRLHKAGKGFRKMTAQQEAVLSRINPDLPKHVYSMIESSMNMDEVISKLFVESVKVDVNRMVDDAIRGTPVLKDSPDLQRILVNTLLGEELNTLLKDVQDVGQVDTAFQNMKNRLNEFVLRLHEQEIVNVEPEVVERVKAGQYAEFLNIWSNLMTKRDDIWQADIKRKADAGARAMEYNANKNAIWKEAKADSAREWKVYNDFELQSYAGLLKVFGVDTTTSTALINAVTQQQDIRAKFFETVSDMERRHFDTIFPENTNAWEIAWNALQDDISRMYDQMLMDEKGIQMQLDQAFANMFAGIGGDPNVATAWRTQVADIRAEIAELNKDVQAKLRDVKDKNKRNEIYQKWQKEYSTLVNQMNYAEINGGQDLNTRHDPTVIPPQPDPETTVNKVKNIIDSQEIIDAADKSKEQNKSQMNRRQALDQMQEAFTLSQQERTAVGIMLDMHAERWAKDNKSTVENWYNTHIAEVTRRVDEGEVNPTDEYNTLAQANKKGSVQFLDDGRAVISAFKAADFSTLVHEIGHIFRRDLNTKDIDTVAKWTGLTDGTEFISLQMAFQNGELSQGMPNYDRYIKAEEQFARGFERYLAEDNENIPPAVQSVFKQFKDWLLKIYKQITGSAIDVDIPPQMRDIYDRLFMDEQYLESRQARASKLQQMPGGFDTYAYGDDTVTPYNFKYRLVELDDLLTSHTQGFTNNPVYPKELQPRFRERVANKTQVQDMAKNIVPERMIDDGHTLETGPMIVGKDMAVESGNGRVMALRMAASEYPESFTKYQAYLQVNAAKFGFTPEQVESMRNPVLVRERTSDTDRIKFVSEANKAPVIPMSDFEQAIADVAYVGDNLLSKLVVDEGESIDTALRAGRNKEVVYGFLNELDIKEKSRLLDKDGYINDAGYKRLKNAMFAKVFPGESGMRLLQNFIDSSEPTMKSIGNALFASLGQLSQMEGLIATGQRPQSLSFVNDLAKAIDAYNKTKQIGMSAELYINQPDVFSGVVDLDPFQQKLLLYLEANGRKSRTLTKTFRNYANNVIGLSGSQETNLFGETYNKADMFDTILRNAEKETEGQQELYQPLTIPDQVTQLLSEGQDAVISAIKDADRDTRNEMLDELNRQAPDVLDGYYQELMGKKPININAPEFQNWWTWDWINNKPGDKPSAVVDADGKPLQVYHGTNQDFQSFYTLGEKGDIGAHFGTLDQANAVAMVKVNQKKGGQNVIPVYLSVQNPLVFEFDPTNFYPQDVADALIKEGSNNYVNIGLDIKKRIDKFNSDLNYDFSKPGTNEAFAAILKDTLKEYGYDGIKYLNTHEGKNVAPDYSYMVFEPEQIKSVFNRGTYDPNNPNILYQPADPIQAFGAVDPGKVPVNRYNSQMHSEILRENLMPLLDAMQEQARKQVQQKPMTFGDVTPEARAEVNKYLEQVRSDMSSTKLASMRYGEQMRDLAMLNYSKRYGFDNVLDFVFPYQFWYTRTMANWAMRMIEKPAWFSMWARIRMLQDKYKSKGMPTRLQGKFRSAMPFLPDWAGGSVYYDPLKQLFPFDQFGQPFENLKTRQSAQTQNAIEILQTQLDNEEITREEYDQAFNDRAGYIWDKAYAKASSENNDPVSLVSLMMSPNLFLTAGSHIAKGQPEKISPMPFTRLGQSIESVGRDTFLEPATNLVGGTLAGPERFVRNKFNLSEFGEWGDYYIDRQLSNMAADGVYDTDTILRAMIDKQGPAYEEAMQRVQYEVSLRMPGILALESTKSGDPKAIASALLVSMFPSGLLPAGELEQRGLKQIADAAWEAKANGDDDAVNRFYDEHPEYAARTALWKEPEERLQNFLASEVWDRYFEQDPKNKKRIQEQFGEMFTDAFLNKETRDYGAIPAQTMAWWAQMLGSTKQLPNVPEIQNIPPNVEMDLLSPETISGIDAYYAERDNLFPNITNIQNYYYDTGKQKSVIQQFPQLKEYWDWNRKYKADHPELQSQLDEMYPKGLYGSGNDVIELSQQILTPEQLEQFDASLIRQLFALYFENKPITSGANNELYRLWEAQGRPGGNFDYYVEEVVKDSLAIK